MKTLYVCRYGMGFSQMAKGFHEFYFPNEESWAAGIDPKHMNPEDGPDNLSVQAMHEKGIDIADYPVQFVQAWMVNSANNVIAFCDTDNGPKFLRKSSKVLQLNVPIPELACVEHIRPARDVIEKIVYGLKHIINSSVRVDGLSVKKYI